MATSQCCRSSFYDEHHNHKSVSSHVGRTGLPSIRIILLGGVESWSTSLGTEPPLVVFFFGEKTGHSGEDETKSVCDGPTEPGIEGDYAW